MPMVELLDDIDFKGIVRSNYPDDKCHSHFPIFINSGMGMEHKEWNMTEQQVSTSNHNKYLAWRHFYPEGKGHAKKGCCLHHINPDWRKTDIERYIQWNIEDLMMMTNYEHKSLHKRGTHLSAETRRKMSEIRKGIQYSDETRRKMSEAHKGKAGHPISEETKRKISEAKKGKKGHPVSEETRRKMSESHKRRR